MVRRILKLSLALAPVTLLYPVVLMLNRSSSSSTLSSKRDAHEIALESGGGDDDESGPTGLTGWYLRLCLRCVENSGAAVIKLMQWAGSRPDLFGHSFCSVFSALQDRARPHPWRHTDRAMARSYGPDWQDHIQLGEILGSGCIGQVYRGKVRAPVYSNGSDDDDGTDGQQYKEVAVKVLHPNVEDDIDADLDLLRLAVRVLDNLPFGWFRGLYWMNLPGIVEEFADMLKLQLDLRNEAANLERFNANFSGDPTVAFPALVEGYKPTKEVLVETFCDGIPVLQFARQNAGNPELLHKLCLTAIQAVCKMIFLDNLMHGTYQPSLITSTDLHTKSAEDVVCCLAAACPIGSGPSFSSR
jgi:aarF domain-containing kinase